jgi:death-on-curing protein
MNEPKWILPDVVHAIHTMLLTEHGGSEGVRDNDLLESALNRAKHKFNYDKGCSLFDLAAAYSFGIAKNHPFVDGNKRTAFTIGVLFIELNGYVFIASETEATLVFESVAGGDLSESFLSSWFQQNTTKTQQ